MAAIQGDGSFNDGWRGLVTALPPYLGVDGFSVVVLERGRNRFTQLFRGYPHGEQHLIVMVGLGDQDEFRTGFRGNQNWRYGRVVAGFVEIFQVERIIPHLVQRIGFEANLSDFEFQDENHRAYEQDDINPLTHARDGVFEVDLACIAQQRLFENGDFLLPGPSLGLFQGKFVRLGELAEDEGWVC